MKEKKWAKFPVLFSLYIAQSIPMSFFSTVVPVIMRQENYSLESIGLLQLVKLPWILKFLWAPIIDRRAGTFRQLKRWIIFSELFYAVVIIAVGILSLETDFKLIVIFMVVAFIASATQDIATDAYAIHILKKQERALGNSMQSAGSFIGSLFGTGVLLIAYYYFGWTILLLLLAAFVVFAIFPLLVYRNKTEISKQSCEAITLKDIYLFFSQKGQHKRVLLLVFYYSGIIGILAMLKPYMVDLGYSVKQIGLMSGIVGTSVAALSAFGSGFIIKKIGKIRSAYIYSLMSIAAAVYFYFVSLTEPSVLGMYIGICMLWGSYGLSTVLIYTSSMDRVRCGREGTDFTIQIVLTHLSGMIVAIMSGKIGDAIGYTGLFGVEVIMGVLALVILIYALNKNKGNEDRRAIIE